MAVAVVTGAPSGIGFNFAAKLLQKGAYAHLILAVRNEARGAETVAKLRAAAASLKSNESSGGTATVSDVRVTALACDLASLHSVRAFTNAVGAITSHVDLLVLNAGLTTGAMFEPTKEVSVDNIEATFAVNHLAHWLIATDLLPLLSAGGKAHVVVTSSIGHGSASIPSSAAGGWRALTKPGATNCIMAYSNTKLANVLLAYELHRRYAAKGIIANAVHPGAIRETNIWHTQTGFARTLVDGILFPIFGFFGKTNTVDQGGNALLIAATAEVGGRYLDIDKWINSSAASRDLKLAAELWELSEQLATSKFSA